MLLSELITHLTNAMSEAGNVVVDGVDWVEHTVADGVHRVGVYAREELTGGKKPPASATTEGLSGPSEAGKDENEE